MTTKPCRTCGTHDKLAHQGDSTMPWCQECLKKAEEAAGHDPAILAVNGR